MGKKSKRRGGTGGGKKSRQAAGAGNAGGASISLRDELTAAAASGAAGPAVTPADALALLETVPPPPSLKGIISTNDDPGKCALCLSPALLNVPSGELGVVFSVPQPCCGKRVCKACDRDTNYGFAPDLLGEHRCTYCNALKSRNTSLSLQEATTGKPWAQYSMGIYHFVGDSPNQAFDYMVKAASQGNPEAFLMLSALCLGEGGHPRDLVAAQIFAKKARFFHPDLQLVSNKALLDIAEKYFEDGAVEEFMGILSDIAKQVDPNALDGALCDSIASSAYQINETQFSSNMWVRAFCFGHVRSALRASDCYFVMRRYALSKLWLSVACKTSSGFHSFVILNDDGNGHKPMFWSSLKFKQRRYKIRAALREIRDSCGGCGAALGGDTRQYCRGCKAFCYCSRECQKLHWNRADGGHRAECKEAQDQACKILEAIQSGKIGLSKNKE